MRGLRSIRRLGILFLLCVSCAAVMAVLTFHNRSEDAGQDEGEETVVGWMIDRIAAGEVKLSDKDSIRLAIDEGEREFGISLTEENKSRIVKFMQTLDTIETGAGDFIEQAKLMYHKYSIEFVEETNDAIDGTIRNAVREAVQSFFQSIMPK